MKNVSPIFVDKKSKVGILLLHGFTSTPVQFREMAEYLSARDFTIYAPVIAGHGTSPEDLINTGPEEWKQSVKDAYLKLKERVQKIVIIGNSFGSNLGLWLAKEIDNESAGIITMGAPIFLRWHKWIKFRLKTYGRFKKYYKKPKRIYRTDYTDMMDEVSYPVIPIKSLKEFLDFIENETRNNLSYVKIPILIASANGDWVIDKKSAAYIFSNIGSPKKEVFWFNSNHHGVAGAGCEGLFSKIYNFIQDVI